MVTLDHDWCNVWLTDKGWMTCEGYEDKTLRSGKRISELSKFTCKEAISEDIEFEFARCTQWTKTNRCETPVSSSKRYDYSDGEAFKELLYKGQAHKTLPRPAFGVFCKK